MKLLLKAGQTSQRIVVFIMDTTSATGGGLTGLTNASSGLSWYYWREDTGNSGGVSISPVSATLGTFTSAGFKEIDATNLPGFYELGVPNAVLASGAKWAVMQLKGAANMPQINVEIELTVVDHQDAVRFGMTALPNANAEAAGGLLTRGTGAGQVNQDANGRIDTNLVKVNGFSPVSDSGTLQAADATHATLRAGAPATDLTNQILLIETGTGRGQWRIISAYNTGTKQATVNTWDTTPDTTSKYIVIGF
jgi:hypothetical protein